MNAPAKKPSTHQAIVAERAPKMTLVEPEPSAAEDQHAKQRRGKCGITAVRKGVQVVCRLPVMHSEDHDCNGITWRRSSGDETE